MDYILQTFGLSKKFGRKFAIDNVSINVHRGDIYGLIGRNGAGKTTLIKTVAGLISPTKGTIKLFGSDDLEFNRRRMGTIVEYPSIHGNLSAKQNLELYCKLYGIIDLKVVDYMLSIVGLSTTGNKKARNFSLGMKQRLGIAIALLGDPDFLILDEPINGLDPTGIKEIRELILKLNREQGITVLISSHILGELSKMATRYGIINNGILINEFTTDELNQACRCCLKIVVDDVKKASIILETILGTTNYDVLPHNVIRLFDHINNAGYVNSELVKNGVNIESLFVTGQDLEMYFMEQMNSSMPHIETAKVDG